MKIEDTAWFDIITLRINFELFEFHSKIESPLLIALEWLVGVIYHILWTTYIGTLVVTDEGTTFDMAQVIIGGCELTATIFILWIAYENLEMRSIDEFVYLTL